MTTSYNKFQIDPTREEIHVYFDTDGAESEFVRCPLCNDDFKSFNAFVAYTPGGWPHKLTSEVDVEDVCLEFEDALRDRFGNIDELRAVLEAAGLLID